jgi:TolB-like protein
MKNGFLIAFLALAFAVPASRTDAQQPPRALIADFVNASNDRHTVMVRAATDATALELTKRGVYAVIAQNEVDRAARERGLRVPYREEDWVALAKELDAPLLITGEIHHAGSRIRDRQREMEVGLIVRVRDLALGEMVNGAAERGIAPDSPDGNKTEGVLLMDAAAAAAARCAARIAAYRPIVGTILSTGSTGGVAIINRGSGDGVRSKQEFLIVNRGVVVARLRAGRVSLADTELKVIENIGGIRPQDKAIAVFPEPKFGPR